MKSLILLSLVLASTYASAGTELIKDEKNDLAMRGYARMGLEFGDSKPELKNYSTRVGFDYSRQARSFLEIGAQFEWAVNLLGSDTYTGATGDNRIEPNSGGSSYISNRLGNVAFKTKAGELRVGKQWSVYSEVAEWSDKFTNSSGDVTGIYSYKGDGGFLGTGRADKAFVYRKEFSRVKFGLQYQAMGGEQIGTIGNHNNGYGANVIAKVVDGLEVGLAHNVVDIYLNNGNSRDPKSTAAAIRYNISKFNFAFVYAWLEDSESSSSTLDTSTLYSKAKGHEAYIAYEFLPNYHIELGHDYLSQENVGNQTKTNFILAGAKYANDVYEMGILGKLDSSKNSSGVDVDDNYVTLFTKLNF
jgi:hypothetical protein